LQQDIPMTTTKCDICNGTGHFVGEGERKRPYKFRDIKPVMGTCDKCNGTGGYGDKPCPNCGGTGETEATFHYEGGNFRVYICPDCNGSGVIHKNYTEALQNVLNSPPM